MRNEETKTQKLIFEILKAQRIIKHARCDIFDGLTVDTLIIPKHFDGKNVLFQMEIRNIKDQNYELKSKFDQLYIKDDEKKVIFLRINFESDTIREIAFLYLFGQRQPYFKCKISSGELEIGWFFFKINIL